MKRGCLAGLALLLALLGACSDEPTGGSSGNDDVESDMRLRDLDDDAVAEDADGDGAGDSSDDQLVEDAAEDTAAEDWSLSDWSFDFNIPWDTSGGDVLFDTGDEGLCDGALAVFTGTNVQDANSDPIRVDDVMAVTIEVIAEAAIESEAVLRIATANLDIDEESISRDGTPIGTAEITGALIDIPLSSIEAAEFTFNATVLSTRELIVVQSQLDLVDELCTVRRSQSGAVLQVLGGEYKIPDCIDMRQFRTLQVAPNIQLQPTADYRTQNGEREDLLAADFIYCPQHPAVVHVAEFCIGAAPGQRVSLAGHYDADADWEADDFVLVEVLENTITLIDDGFTTQTHPGGDTFWCDETQDLMCEAPGCQATLTVTAEVRAIEPIAIVSAVGERPRRFDDGAVEITSLLPDDGSFKVIRITFLDVGIEGLLDPQLYLVSEDPE